MEYAGGGIWTHAGVGTHGGPQSPDITGRACALFLPYESGAVVIPSSQ